MHIGHHVIPNALAQEMKIYAYQHDGYWHVSTPCGWYYMSLWYYESVMAAMHGGMDEAGCHWRAGPRPRAPCVC